MDFSELSDADIDRLMFEYPQAYRHIGLGVLSLDARKKPLTFRYAWKFSYLNGGDTDQRLLDLLSESAIYIEDDRAGGSGGIFINGPNNQTDIVPFSSPDPDIAAFFLAVDMLEQILQ